MISYRFALVLLMSMALTIISSTSTYAISSDIQTTTPSATYTPAKGTSDRKEIMDTLRTLIKKMAGLEVIFVVRYLKVNSDWAWVIADPQSINGKEHYEPLVGLLHKINGRWTYVEGPPEYAVCEEDPECIDTALYFKKLRRKYPATSPDIFPK